MYKRQALYLSFTNKVVGKPEEFVGLENYIKLFHDPIYWKSLKNTLVYTVGCIAAKLALGLLWAVLLNRNFKGKSFFRTVLLIPWAIPGMVAATTWRWMYDSTYGIINSLLISLGDVYKRQVQIPGQIQDFSSWMKITSLHR